MARKTATAPTTPKTPKKAPAKTPATLTPDEQPLVQVNLGDAVPNLPKIIDGLAHLSTNGLRYPIPQYGMQNDARAGLAVSYGNT
jgi:hypothetical protein